MKFNLCKTPTGFSPATDADKEKVSKIGQGEIVSCRSVDQRSVEFNAKYWALADLVVENIPESTQKNLLENHQYQIKNSKAFHFYVKLKKGYIERKFVGKGGNIGWEPMSIAFDKMNEHEFQKFYNDAVDVALELLGAKADEMMSELLDFL